MSFCPGNGAQMFTVAGTGVRAAALTVMMSSLALGAPPQAHAQSSPPRSSPTHATQAPLRADFDGDGRDDLAAGVPGAAIAGVTRAGAVVVRYSRPALGARRITQNSPGVPGAVEAFDNFGSDVTSGDLNGDGFADLVLGTGNESIGSVPGAGAVTILYGSPGGLGSGQSFSQDTPGVPGAPESNDFFGDVLAVGDANGDGYDDLALGLWNEYADGGRGAVIFIPGGRTGPVPSRSQWWSQATAGVAGSPEIHDVFGSDVVFADVDGNGRDDLLVTAPGDAWGASYGVVHVFPGSASGPTSQGSRVLTGSGDDQFGTGLARGDITGDGTVDVAVAVVRVEIVVPDEQELEDRLLAVFTGSPAGLDPASRVTWSPRSPGVPAGGGSRSFTGFDLADVNGDHRADLLAGTDTQAVVYLRGGPAGLTTAGAQAVSQDSPGIPGGTETLDGFGTVIAAADLNGDRRADLLVGAPGEEVSGVAAVGRVTIIPGSAGGLTGSGTAVTTSSLGLAPLADTAGEEFGSSIAP